MSHPFRAFLTLLSSLALLTLGACDGGDCVDFDPQGRCIKADTTGGDTVATGVVVESGVVSIALPVITERSRSILNDDGWCECGFCHTVWFMRSDSASLSTGAPAAYTAFLDEVADKLGSNPRTIEVTRVSVAIDPSSVNVTGYEQVLTDLVVYLAGENVFELGAFTGVTGVNVATDVADPGNLLPLWRDPFLSGDYVVGLRATTAGSRYTSNCVCAPQCPDCACTEFPDTFELKLVVNLELRAEG